MSLSSAGRLACAQHRSRIRQRFSRSLGARLALLLVAIGALGVPLPAYAGWRPSLAERRFDIQLSVPLDLTRPADILALDLFTTPPERIAALRARGVATVCHLAAGRWENWRPDAAGLPGGALGGSAAGWPGERWVDIRHPALRPFLERRLDLCRARGFDGVLLADLDGYAHAPGFPYSRADQVAFDLWLAGAAHERGLAAGLVDDPGQAGELAHAFDFLVASDCLDGAGCPPPDVSWRQASRSSSSRTPTSRAAWTNSPTGGRARRPVDLQDPDQERQVAPPLSLASRDPNRPTRLGMGSRLRSHCIKQILEIVGVERVGDVEALGDIAAEFAKQAQLVRILHAFGHRSLAQRSTQSDDTSYQRLVLHPHAEITHERAVDLDRVDR